MMLACQLDPTVYMVTIYEKNTALGRKFLVAGNGGFNLTHAEDERQFADRYLPKDFIGRFFREFTNTDLRKWLRNTGIETYTGTSRRVFPVKGVKPIEVLKAIEAKMISNGVTVHYRHHWTGWQGKQLLFRLQEGTVAVDADIVVFALGGGSWKVTGSTGDWLPLLAGKGITVREFLPSNCAYRVGWDPEFIRRYAGNPLKNCAFSCDDRMQKGEAVLTESGIEGSGIYPLSPAIRRALLERGSALLRIDLKPDLPISEIRQRLHNRGQASVKAVLEQKLNLSPVQIALLKAYSTKAQYQDAEELASCIKSLPIQLQDFGPLDEAISTVGGIAIDELTEHQELKKLPDHFAIGEMSDWDAPTGGYLLQACFSMGFTLAKYLNSRR